VTNFSRPVLIEWPLVEIIIIVNQRSKGKKIYSKPSNLGTCRDEEESTDVQKILFESINESRDAEWQEIFHEYTL
jgi:hypothetical protein